MTTDAPKPHSMTLPTGDYALWRSGRIRHFVRSQGARLMARGERVLLYQSSPRAYLGAAMIHRIDRIMLREDIALLNGLRLGDREADLLAFQAGCTDYPSLLATLRHIPHDGILLQLTAIR